MVFFSCNKSDSDEQLGVSAPENTIVYRNESYQSIQMKGYKNGTLIKTSSLKKRTELNPEIIDSLVLKENSSFSNSAIDSIVILYNVNSGCFYQTFGKTSDLANPRNPLAAGVKSEKANADGSYTYTFTFPEDVFSSDVKVCN
ncbi:MAG: hypothetical protein C4K58_01215 [Flavobacteriaceae bacterium]|nr:MAG: hypothetical protein C4K58_01215 [Flavobacteriaceae bacterium]